MAVTLQPVTRENFRACVHLRVTPDQEHFVAPNVFSIAEAYVEPTWQPLAVYDEGVPEPVGFAMYGHDAEADRWWIVRFMIDAAHQGRGYGATAMRSLVARIVESHDPRAIYLSYVPGNAVAERLYAQLGFVPTGEVEEGEVVARLDLSPSVADPRPPTGRPIPT